MAFIELDSVSFAYPQSDTPALVGLSLSIAEGEYVAVLGANGSGKSSLLRLFDGLLVPGSGELRVDGLPTSSEGGRRAARAAVGIVFQSPADQIVSTSVEEDSAFGPENLGLPRAEIRLRVDSALAAVGLEGFGRRATQSLSAGQQQRLAVAGALATDARCIAFDEATSMLDPEARTRILGLMDGLIASGKTVVHVTHDMDEAARASRILILDSGRLVFDGSPGVLFAPSADPRASEAGAPPPAPDYGLGRPPGVELALELGLEPRLREPPDRLAARIAGAVAAGSLRLRPASGLEGLGSGAAFARDASRSAADSASGSPCFELRGAGHAYLRGTAGETLALREVDLAVPEGAVLALVGRTGSGKSTALQLLDGLISASSGKALAFGLDLHDPSVDLRAVRTRAPLSVQRPESALFERYAADDVAFGPRNLGLSGGGLVDRVKKAMGETGLPYELFRDRRTRSLSGGEKRRLALAGVFAMAPSALLLDEPTSALDPAAKEALLGLILAKAREGATVVMATHSMNEAAKADLVAVFAGGRLVALRDPETLFYDSYDPAWGIDRPFACEIALELEKLGLSLRPRPLALAALAAAFERGGTA
jgi:energy-coupling factor transporter ATP-binding protein EcfA2